jgi:hypothetical protein
VAIYDATIAAWDSEYTYNRRHSGEVDPGLTTVIANPRSSSHPSEHAVAAGAASAVLAYIFPDCAAFFAEQAEAAGRSLLLAGVAYPSDVEAGLELPPHAQAIPMQPFRNSRLAAGALFSIGTKPSRVCFSSIGWTRMRHEPLALTP